MTCPRAATVVRDAFTITSISHAWGRRADPDWPSPHVHEIRESFTPPSRTSNGLRLWHDTKAAGGLKQKHQWTD